MCNFCRQPGCLFLLSLLLALWLSSSVAARNKLRLQALWPLESPDYRDPSGVPAISMALDDINSSPHVLPDYELVIDVVDTMCDSSIGSWRLIQSILNTTASNGSKIIGIVGGGCSLATEPTAALSGKLYDIVQISPVVTSPALSDRYQYPLFFRTSPSENVQNEARFAFSQEFNWCRVATLHHTVNIYSLAVVDFHDRFHDYVNMRNCSENSTQLYSFARDPMISLQQIKEDDIRIIHGFFYEEEALVVMCYAEHLQLTTPNHQWILPGYYSNGWWYKADTFNWSQYHCQCTSSDIKRALNNTLLVDVYPFNENPEDVTVSGHTNSTFFDQYYGYWDNYTHLNHNFSDQIHYPTLVYDAVWTLALALNETETDLVAIGSSLNDYRYTHGSSNEFSDAANPSVNISRVLFSKMNETDFLGLSGRVKFDINGTRRLPNSILQYWNINGEIVQMLLAIYDYESDGLLVNYSRNEPLWKLGRPPTDRSTPQSKLLNPALIYAMNVIIAIGIVVAVVFLIFNIVTIRKPLIANSTPYINMIITVGCIIMMATSILLGIDSGTPQVTSGDRVNVLDNIDDAGKRRFAIICMVRLWLFTIGFTLSFGALFAKTCQVYRIYFNERHKDEPFKLWNFLIIMGIQIALDVFLLSIWTSLFPFRHEVVTDIDKMRNRIDLNEKCQCQNFSYLVGALYVYKGLLVVFGLFLAYESRNVKYYYINDSRFVSIAMYIMFILIGISAPLSLVLADQFFINPAYVVAVIMIVTACMCCLLILYIPKFIYMAKGADTMLPKAKAEVFTPVDNLKLGYQEEETPVELRDVKFSDSVDQVDRHNHIDSANVGSTSSGSNSSPPVTLVTEFNNQTPELAEEVFEELNENPISEKSPERKVKMYLETEI